MSEILAKITQGSRLARNTVINLLGQGAPMLVALFAIPLLIKGLGTDRFGVLTLIWLVMGYFSLFDLGLGRALTQMVSRKLGSNQTHEVPVLVWTSLPLMLLLGLVGTLALGLLTPWIVSEVLSIPRVLQPETLRAFYFLALSLPIVVSDPSLRGLLEAHQRFDMTNAVRSALGIYTFLSPLLVLPFSKDLSLIVAVLLLGRLIAWLANFLLVLHVIPNLRQGIRFKASGIRPLLRFGSWMMVTNIVGPLMVYLDRFLLGALISMAAVAYYATPFEVVSKLWLLPGALVGVLFPAMSATFSGDQPRAAELSLRGVKYIFLGLFPLSLVIVTLAPEGLALWLGTEFAQHSFRVLQLIAIGVFINSLAWVPFALVQGAGRPDLTAKLHLTELPLYLLILWCLIKAFGLEGAALAWVLRVALDAILLFYLARRLLASGLFPLRQAAVTMGAALITLILATFVVGPMTKGFFLVSTLIAFIWAAWFLILSREERAQLRNRLKIFPAPPLGQSYNELRK